MRASDSLRRDLFVSRVAKLLAGIVLLLETSTPARAEDWPQWRGPRRDGTALADALPDPLPASIAPLWRAKVGAGYSSPVVVAGRVYLMARESEEKDALEYFIALDATTGKVAWKSEAWAAPFVPPSYAASAGFGPKATVAVADGRVYGLGINEMLACLDASTGKTVWRKDYGVLDGEVWTDVGSAASPLIDGDLCITQVGRKTSGGLAAFDRKTGEKVWAIAGDGPSYCAPQAFELAGVRQVGAFTKYTFTSVDPATGCVLWSLPFKTEYEQNIVSPVVAGDRLILTGIKAGTIAVRLERIEAAAGAASPVASGALAPGASPAEAILIPKGADDSGYMKSPGHDAARPHEHPLLEPRVAWRNDDQFSYMSSPVVKDGHLYFLSDKRKGSVVCLSAADGSLKWQSPGRVADFASVTLVGDRLMILLDTGEIRIARAVPTGYEELAHWTVASSPTWAHPALAEGKLFLKDADSVICFSMR